MRTISFYNSTAVATTVSWTVDKDCFIVGTAGAGSPAVLSEEPDLTYALFATTPPATEVKNKFRLQLQTYFTGMLFPLYEGRVIYVAFSAVKGSDTIILQDADELQLF